MCLFEHYLTNAWDAMESRHMRSRWLENECLIFETGCFENFSGKSGTIHLPTQNVITYAQKTQPTQLHINCHESTGLTRRRNTAHKCGSSWVWEEAAINLFIT